MAAFSGFYESHGPTSSGNARGAIKMASKGGGMLLIVVLIVALAAAGAILSE
jgi:hypothetical protein